MISYSKISNFKPYALGNIQKPSLIARLIISWLPLISVSTPALKISFYTRYVNFIRAITIQILRQNLHLNLFNENLTKNYYSSSSNRIIQSLIDVAVNFNIAKVKNNTLHISQSYAILIKNNSIPLDILNADTFNTPSYCFKKHGKLFNDFRFICDLIKRYRDTEYTAPFIFKQRQKWLRLVDMHQLDYEVRLCETLLNLKDLHIPQKIKSPYNEAYYTESGRNAFQNYTKHQFLNCYREITTQNKDVNVLDIGCGYGNYINLIHNNFPMHRITGIEINPEVYQTVSQTFSNNDTIDIFNQNILHYKISNTYDVILLNYAIFYFNRNDKLQLLKKIRKLLNPGGSFLMCQYFSQIEKLKHKLASIQNRNSNSITQQLEMYFANKVLYLNTLWNDSADTFSEAARWNEIHDLATQAGLRIHKLTNADKFYYSLFIEFKAF